MGIAGETVLAAGCPHTHAYTHSAPLPEIGASIRGVAASADAELPCRELYAEPPHVNILIGDQGSTAFWQEVLPHVGF